MHRNKPIAARSTRPAPAVPSAGIAQAPVPIRAVFFNVEVCNIGLAVSNRNDLTTTIYSDAYSLKFYWRAASNNRAYLDESTSAVVELRLPCDQFSIDSCDVGKWNDYARDNPDALGGVDFSQYQFQVSMCAYKQ